MENEGSCEYHSVILYYQLIYLQKILFQVICLQNILFKINLGT